MKGVGLDQAMLREKFAGVTTDGESVNTGRSTGLWKRLEDNVGHKLINFWCACHRSDLAMEDLEASVPELKVWKANLLSIPEFYHRSSVRRKVLQTVLPTMKAYPSYHDVRFEAGFHLNECNDSAEAALVGACVLGSNVDSPSADLGRIG